MTFDDPYLDQASGVLRNRLDIVDAAQLSQVESEVSLLRDHELKLNPLPGRYDLAHLAAFHRRMFGEVNAVHPFREGNGRTQRAFFRQLGLQAGWRVDFALLDRAACRECMTGPSSALRSVFDHALVGPVS